MEINASVSDDNNVSLFNDYGLVSWWRMDEGSWVIDEAGGGCWIIWVGIMGRLRGVLFRLMMGILGRWGV